MDAERRVLDEDPRRMEIHMTDDNAIMVAICPRCKDVKAVQGCTVQEAEELVSNDDSRVVTDDECKRGCLRCTGKLGDIAWILKT